MLRACALCSYHLQLSRTVKMTPLVDQAFATELLLKVATCIVERHSGHVVFVAPGPGGGQQAQAVVDTQSQTASPEEANVSENARPEPGAMQVTPPGVDIMLDTALSRLEQQIQIEEGCAARYTGPGLRAKPKKVELGSGKSKGKSGSSESCFG